MGLRKGLCLPESMRVVTNSVPKAGTKVSSVDFPRDPTDFRNLDSDVSPPPSPRVSDHYVERIDVGEGRGTYGGWGRETTFLRPRVVISGFCRSTVIRDGFRSTPNGDYSYTSVEGAGPCDRRRSEDPEERVERVT